MRPCPDCGGTRLNRAARFVFVAERSLPETAHMTVGTALEFFDSLNLAGWRGEVASKIVKDVAQRLRFLVDVGLDYLTLDRSAETLSGGEAQRIRLASQVGSGLTGVMYILDEPSIGLHQRDNQRLLGTLKRLRDIGNTVIVVEHDEEAILEADYVVDLGPGAGVHGGHIVAQGTPREIQGNPASITGQYLSGKRQIPLPRLRTLRSLDKQIRIVGATGNNLRNVTRRNSVGPLHVHHRRLRIGQVDPHHRHPVWTRHISIERHSAGSIAVRAHRRTGPDRSGNRHRPESYRPHTPVESGHVHRALCTAARAVCGSSPKHAPAVTTLEDSVSTSREAAARRARAMAVIKVEMHFLPDVYVPCDVCKGQRYNRETLEIRYRGKNIHEALDMTVEDALRFFQNIPGVAGKLQTLTDVGLSYVRLGQNATHAVGRRSPARQAGPRAGETRHRQDALHTR